MITYRKKSLKVHNIFASNSQRDELYTHAIARQLQNFIESDRYSRIVEIIKLKTSRPESMVLSIIYEKKN
jgi:hypothetical protein